MFGLDLVIYNIILNIDNKLLHGVRKKKKKKNRSMTRLFNTKSSRIYSLFYLNINPSVSTDMVSIFNFSSSNIVMTSGKILLANQYIDLATNCISY